MPFENVWALLADGVERQPTTMVGSFLWQTDTRRTYKYCLITNFGGQLPLSDRQEGTYKYCLITNFGGQPALSERQEGTYKYCLITNFV